MINVHQREFELISDEIRKAIPREVDGREAILKMKNEGLKIKNEGLRIKNLMLRNLMPSAIRD